MRSPMCARKTLDGTYRAPKRTRLENNDDDSRAHEQSTNEVRRVETYENTGSL